MLKEHIEETLGLQPNWSAQGVNPAMARRREIVRDLLPQELENRRTELARVLHCDAADLVIEGKDGAGHRSRVPWVRVGRRSYSPSAREGWYVVILFAEDGSKASMAVIQGTQLWGSEGLRSQPRAIIDSRTEWAREVLVGTQIESAPRTVDQPVLGPSAKSRDYEAGTARAFEYSLHRFPTEDLIWGDLEIALDGLRKIYEAADRVSEPSELDPDLDDALKAIDRIAGKSKGSARRFRSSSAQRKAVELRAMKVAAAHWVEKGWTIEDTSSNSSFDLRATRDSESLTIEVKGTVGPGSSVILTRNEVNHHLEAHPQNALAIVSHIKLAGSREDPIATEGDLRVISPWRVEDGTLNALAFDYEVPA